MVTFKIVDTTSLLDRFLNDAIPEYENFESKSLAEPDFVVYLGDFTPSNQCCYILDDRHYVKKNYLYCEEESYKLAKWKVQISGFEENPLVMHISTNVFGNMFLSPLINCLLDFKLNEKGYSLVHASCVGKNGGGYLFAARSGAGKTITALHFIEKGLDFLGDNFVILRDGEVLSFLSPLNIFSYNLAPVIKRNLEVKHKLILNVKNLLYIATGGYVKLFTKLNPKDLFPDSLVDRCKLKMAFLLMPGEETRLQRIDKEELVDHLVLNQGFEWLPLLANVLEYSYMFPGNNLSNHWEKYKENLRKNLTGDISFCKVEMSQAFDKRLLEETLPVAG